MARPLDLAEIIDAELQFAEDRRRERDELARRDSALGGRIQADRLAGSSLVRQWLRQLRSSDESVGRRVQRVMEGVLAAATTIGIFLGVSLIWGWLAAESGRPVNVIHLWSATVGVQLALLALLLTALVWSLLGRRLPGAAPLGALYRCVASRLPIRFSGYIARHLSPERRRALRDLKNALSRLDQAYGKMRLLAAMKLIQLFAVGFNLGAIGALFLVTYVTDPAFGWRSRMLDADSLAKIARWVAIPWGWTGSRAAPTREEVERSKYTSLEPRFEPTSAEERRVWAAWWPFLLASLACYGLAPRLALLALVAAWSRSFRAGIMRRHPQIAALRDRLLSPLVQTEGPNPQAPVRPRLDSGPPGLPEIGAAPIALKWRDVPIGNDDLKKWLQRRLGRPVEDIRQVGPSENLEESDRPLALVVEAWEPPVGEVLDVLERLVRQGSSGRPILIFLYSGGTIEHPAPAASIDLEQWRRGLERLGDPKLGVWPIWESPRSEPAP